MVAVLPGGAALGCAGDRGAAGCFGFGAWLRAQRRPGYGPGLRFTRGSCLLPSEPFGVASQVDAHGLRSCSMFYLKPMLTGCPAAGSLLPPITRVGRSGPNWSKRPHRQKMHREIMFGTWKTICGAPSAAPTKARPKRRGES